MIAIIAMHIHHIYSLNGQFCAITNKFVSKGYRILKLEILQFFPTGRRRNKEDQKIPQLGGLPRDLLGRNRYGIPPTS